MVLQSVMFGKSEDGWDGGVVYIVEFMDQYEYQSQRLRRDLFKLVVDDSLLEITVLTVNGL